MPVLLPFRNLHRMKASCTTCSNIISRQYEVWPVIPEPTSLGLALVSSEPVAARQASVVQVVAVTERGRDEGRYRVQHESHERFRLLASRRRALAGGTKSRSSWPTGRRCVATDVLVQLVFSKSMGPVGSFSTYGNDSMCNRVTGHVGHVILCHLDVASIIDGAATFLLNPGRS